MSSVLGRERSCDVMAKTTGSAREERKRAR
jgi:hypothetical protein